jgi:hypothetical protein
MSIIIRSILIVANLITRAERRADDATGATAIIDNDWLIGLRMSA